MSYFKDLRLMHKFTYSFLLFIMIPSLILCLISYDQIKQRYHDDLRQNWRMTLQQIAGSISQKKELVESVSMNISFNTRLTEFLATPLAPTSEDIEYYRDKITPLVTYAVFYHKITIKDISIYMVNTEIPEGFGDFFHIDRVKDKAWYRDFLLSDAVSLWLVPGMDDLFGSNPDEYAYVHKIYTEAGTYVGLSSISISKEELFGRQAELPDKSDVIFAVPSQGPILYLNGHMDKADEKLLQQTGMERADIERGKSLMMTEPIPDLKSTIGVVTALPRMEFLSLTVGIPIFLMIAMLIAFYILLRTMLMKMIKNVRMMDRIIENNFSTRIPIERKDEIGQIALRYNQLLDKIQVLIEEGIKRETAHKDTQLKALQLQIKPHFFYNTLDIFVNRCALAGDFEVADAIAHFGKMIRYVIDDNSMYTTVETEILHMKSYIGLQNLRLNRLKLQVDLPDELREIKIIRFIMQPIIENSIMHGFSSNSGDLQLRIGVREENGLIYIEMEDNGKGLPGGKLERMNRQFREQTNEEPDSNDGSGIGLQNINFRIKLFYGSSYCLYMESVENEFTRTVMVLPNIAYQG